MTRGGGKQYEICPKCGKKGLYVIYGTTFPLDTRCRYCYAYNPKHPHHEDESLKED
jgi:hypothetical protein